MAEKTTAKKETTTKKKTKNIFEKLNELRIRFMEANVHKSGINESSEYDYFELSDILPVAMPLMNEIGLAYIVTFPESGPVGMLFDTEKPEDSLTFYSTKVEGPIITTGGKKIMTDIQSEGGKQTYHRRYLWMQLLEVVDYDGIDSQDMNAPAPPTVEVKEEKHQKPATPAERQELKEELTDVDAQADELQIDALKAVLKRLYELDDTQSEFINKVLVETDGFTNISKKTCEELITKVGEVVEGLEKANEVADN